MTTITIKKELTAEEEEIYKVGARTAWRHLVDHANHKITTYESLLPTLKRLEDKAYVQGKIAAWDDVRGLALSVWSIT